MKLSISEIVSITNAKAIGNKSFIAKGVNSFADSKSCDITFACEAKFLKNLHKTNAGAVFIPDKFVFDEKFLNNIVVLQVENPKSSFFKLVEIFHPKKPIKRGIHESAILSENISLGKNIAIMANVFIGNNVEIKDNVHIMPGVYIADDVSIGANTIIKPNVTIMEKTKIGKNCIIHSASVIGCDGFGFVQEDGGNEKLVHTGYVLIGDDVEIGAGNTIDKGTLGTTVIGNKVKIDNLVHIAHNVKIGDNTLIVAQVGIAGSTKIGKNVIIAGKAGISGHIEIGDSTIIGPYTGVHSNVGKKQIVSGIPHMQHKRWRNVVSIISRLPEIRKKIFSFENRLKELETKHNGGKKDFEQQ